jgi:ADP-heptose:LPS heptosyltransferase
MNVTTMRFVDRWAGTPVCAILTLWRRITAPFRSKPPEAPQRILVVKLAEQGATVLAYSALRRATELVGRDNVFFVVFSENRFILDQIDVIPPENVIELRTTGLVRLGLDLLKAVVRFRREKIDAAVDFEFFARSSAIVTYLSGASRRAGFHSFAGEASYRGDLMTHRLVFNPLVHASQTFRSLVEALCFPAEQLPTFTSGPWPDEQPPTIEPSDDELREVSGIVAKTANRDSAPPLILLNANASDLLPLRRWAPERYVELARKLLDRYPEVFIGFTGAPSEAADAQKIVDEIGSERCINMGGRTTLRQLLVLYFLSEVMVTNDSGPAHYAALSPMDVVTIFGPETPAVFGSKSKRAHLLWEGLPCSPCVNAFNDRWTPCQNNVCMQRITVDQVFAEICGIYERRRALRNATDEAS